MRSFGWEWVKSWEERVWTACKERQKERTARGKAVGREQEARRRRRRGCPVMLKPSIFERVEGKDTGRKRGKKKGERFASHPGFITMSIWREREREREKQAGQGPAVGPDPYGAAGSGMNSEWSGWALGCWNLPPSLCEQDDQRQEGALQMAQAINR